jgi:hypothetical protein
VFVDLLSSRFHNAPVLAEGPALPARSYLDFCPSVVQ